MVKCGLCKQEGHRKPNCPENPSPVKKDAKATKVKAKAPSNDGADDISIILDQDIVDKLDRLTELCVEVANGLHKGHVEAHYQEALYRELQDAGIKYVAEEAMPIIYKGRPLGGTCSTRLDVMLHSFLPFIFELKAEGNRIKSKHHWQLVRYMDYKKVPYGAVVNFNQSEKGPLEIHFIVSHEDDYWLYNPISLTGRKLVDFSLTTQVVNETQDDEDESDEE
jgi:GxxExxY protein